MKYSWASITKSCTNYGNLLIEYNLIKLLEKHGFTKPDFVFDSLVEQDKKTIDRINETDFLIIPGCTTLFVSHYLGLKSVLRKIKIPIYNIGATFFGRPMPDFFEFESCFERPIALRDPKAKQFLDENKIENLLVGCPTLFTGKATKIQPNFGKNIVFIFGLGNIKKQIEIYKLLVKEGYQVTVILQEKVQNEFLSDLNANVVKYTPENIIREFNKTHLVVTGRLHGALPALALGVPVFFIDTIETVASNRFSLLEYLGLQKHSFNDADIEQKLVNYASKNNYDDEYKIVYEKIEELRKNFDDYLAILKEKVVSKRKIS